MPSVEIIMPDLEGAITAALQRKIDASLEVGVENLGKLIRLTAISDNVDVDGATMPMKKPRPKRNPRNNPNAPLVWEDEGQIHMMDASRWSSERLDNYTFNVVYAPPDYFPYVIQERPWLTYDRMNEAVRAEVADMMRTALEDTE